MKKRLQLVKMVLKGRVPLSDAIEQLGLKMTTARFIINKYRETGTFPRRKFKKRCKKEGICKLEDLEPNHSIVMPPSPSSEPLEDFLKV